LASVASGCAAERDPINRVQANAMAKSFFVGEKLRDPGDDPEFRMKTFNVGGSVGQEAYTVGEYGALDRVRWEITENLLVARKAYQVVENADNRGIAKSDWDQHADDKTLVKSPNGAIVAAYRILSHFDIRREYNAHTGEELNVVEENTTDRAWYDRAYMRVDWSTNIVDGPNDPTRYFSDQLGGNATPMAYSVSDPKGDDAPHVDVKQGYFDVTNKFTVEPDSVQFPWGTIRRCQLVAFMTGSSSFDCNPQEATVRLSFSRIAPDEDFEPFEDSVAWRDVVGNMGGDGDAAQLSFGTAPRQTWDPQYGITDAMTKRFKNIHNMFVKSHQAATCTTDSDTDRNGTADDCENATTGYKGRSGSRCDVYVGKCTLPVRDRELKTIGYWMNAEAPDVLQDELDSTGKFVKRGTLEDLTYSWNQLLEVSLAYRREVECRKTGDGDRASCHAEYFDGEGPVPGVAGPSSKVMVAYGGWLIDKVKAQGVDKGKPVVVSCHNPVRSYDPEQPCGKPGDRARLGDQRKNFLAYWPFDSRAHYGGVAGVTPDPLTGEIHGASATIMGRSATYAAAMQRDIIQVALGDMNLEDIVQGVPSDKFAATLRSGSLSAPGLTHALSASEIAHRTEVVDTARVQSIAGQQAIAATPRDQMIAEVKAAQKTTFDPQAALGAIAQFDALAQKLRGSALESKVVDSHWLTGTLGTSPTTAPNEDLLSMVSPLRGFDPMRTDAMRAFYDKDLGERGACFDATMASGPGSVYLASLAGYFKAKYGSLDKIERGKRIYDDLWKESVKGIGLHELGHSLGLRHNFASSWDSPNYNPQYWQLRTAEGTLTNACDGPHDADKDNCMGPRYVDPMSTDEQGIGPESRPAIDYFANTSTMEYQLERFGETVGLGTYDLHAMKALYGRVLETFDDRVMPLADQKAFAAKTFTQLSDRDFIDQKTKFTTHYTSTARAMKVFDKARDCRPATDEEKEHATWRVVHGQVCSPAPKDHWSFSDFTSEEIPGMGIAGAKWHVKDRDGKDRVRWEYRYGEQYGSGGYMHTSMGDAGADVYELVQNLSRRFQLTYPWSYFRRHNEEYMPFTLPQSVATQYFMRARAYHWQIASSFARPQIGTQLNDDDGLRPFVMAQPDLLSFLASAVLVPEPGTYAVSDTRALGSVGLMPIYDVSDKGNAFTIGISDGRYVGEDFDNDIGGSWDYQKFLHHAGYEVEKSLAIMQLVDPRPTLFSVARENFLDDRNVYYNFRTDLPDAVDRLVGGLLAEDWESIAPAVAGGESASAGQVTPVDLTTTTSREPGARVVFPNIGYKQQLSLAIFAALFSRLGSDMTLVEKMRVWVDGDRAPQIPGAREARFADPRTGFVYIANRFGTEAVGSRTIDKGIASRMIERANSLLTTAYDVKKDTEGKPVLGANGTPELKLDANGQPIVLNGGAETSLRRYIGLLDAVRQIGRALGDGPLGGAGGGEDESAR
jgi:hypothetical protein